MPEEGELLLAVLIADTAAAESNPKDPEVPNRGPEFRDGDPEFRDE